MGLLTKETCSSNLIGVSSIPNKVNPILSWLTAEMIIESGEEDLITTTSSKRKESPGTTDPSVESSKRRKTDSEDLIPTTQSQAKDVLEHLRKSGSNGIALQTLEVFLSLFCLYAYCLIGDSGIVPHA